ncbi:hypothetical protein CHS0354_039502, partial [Potamilus streckersoni]
MILNNADNTSTKTFYDKLKKPLERVTGIAGCLLPNLLKLELGLHVCSMWRQALSCRGWGWMLPGNQKMKSSALVKFAIADKLKVISGFIGV